jgi:hypothetical protein
MENLREAQKAEAIVRMQELVDKLEANPHLVDYLKEGKVYYSYVSGLPSIDTITYDPEYVKAVKAFEKEYNAYVFHAIETHTVIGKMLSLLFVGEYEDDWEEDHFEMTQNRAYAYVVNMDGNARPEIGTIGLEAISGAILRTD